MRNIKNNIIFKAFLIFTIGVLLCTLMPLNVYAMSEEEDSDLYIDGHKILSIYYGDSNIKNRMYADPDPFTFTDVASGATRYYDGKYMALEATATSTAGVILIHIDLLIYNTGTHHDCTVWSDGEMCKFDWLSLGNKGGSAADCYYYVDSPYTGYTHTVDVKSYSWIS